MPGNFSLDLATTPVVFLDTEFTDLLAPELLSLGLVSTRGDEHYVELDLDDPHSAATLENASDFVRHNGVLDQWGRVPGSAASYRDMGLRTARWLQDQAARYGQPVQVAFDYAMDFELLEYLLRDAGQWKSMREILRPLNVDELASPFEGTFSAEMAYEALRRRGLERHHALADTHALRAACITVLTGKRVRL